MSNAILKILKAIITSKLLILFILTPILLGKIETAQGTLRGIRIDTTQPKELEPVKFSGILQNINKEPINQAHIWIYHCNPENGPYELPIMTLLYELESNQEGKFEFQYPKDTFIEKDNDYYQDKLVIIAQKENYALGWQCKSFYDEPNCIIVLKEPKHLQGYVRDINNIPVPNAEVRAILTEPVDKNTLFGTIPVDYLITVSNAVGFFEFNNLPGDEKVQFIVTAPGFVRLISSEVAGLYTMNARKSDMAGQDKDVFLTLEKVSSIEGVVINKKNGIPVENVELEIKYRDGLLQNGEKKARCRSGGNGKFKIDDLPKGSYFVYTAPQQDDKKWYSPKSVFQIESGLTTSGIIEVSRGASLEIDVKDAITGRPVKNASVNINQECDVKRFGKPEGSPRRLFVYGELTQTITTDTDGRAKINLAECDYSIKVGAPDFDYGTSEVTLTEGENKVIKINLGEETFCVIAVKDENGKSEPNMCLQTYNWSGPLITADSNGIVICDKDCFVGKEGTYIIARDPNRNLVGVYKVEKNFEYANLILKKGSSIKGRFIDDHKNPVDNMQIKISLYGYPMRDYEGNIESSFLITDKEGYFEIPALPQGFKYELQAEQKGYTYFTREVDLNKETLDLGEIMLYVAGSSVTGILVDDNNKPIPRHALGAFNNEKHISINPIFTDANGRFIIEGVIDAPLYIYTGGDDEYTHKQIQCKGGDSNVKIILNRKVDAIIEIQTLDSNTRLPLENITILIICSNPPFTANLKPNKNGLAFLKCQDKGKYRIAVAGLTTKNYVATPFVVDVNESKTYKAEVIIK